MLLRELVKEAFWSENGPHKIKVLNERIRRLGIKWGYANEKSKSSKHTPPTPIALNGSDNLKILNCLDLDGNYTYIFTFYFFYEIFSLTVNAPVFLNPELPIRFLIVAHSMKK